MSNLSNKLLDILYLLVTAVVAVVSACLNFREKIWYLTSARVGVKNLYIFQKNLLFKAYFCFENCLRKKKQKHFKVGDINRTETRVITL